MVYTTLRCFVVFVFFVVLWFCDSISVFLRFFRLFCVFFFLFSAVLRLIRWRQRQKKSFKKPLLSRKQRGPRGLKNCRYKSARPVVDTNTSTRQWKDSHVLQLAEV